MVPITIHYIGWIVNNAFTNSIVSSCENVNVLGGAGSFVMGTYVTKHVRLMPHYKLKIKAQLWKYYKNK